MPCRTKCINFRNVFFAGIVILRVLRVASRKNVLQWACTLILFITPELLCAWRPGIRNVSTGPGREWFKTNMASFRASLHAPSSLVCSAAESDNSSEVELPFDENIRRFWLSVIAMVLYTTKDKIEGGFWYTKRFLEPLISVCVPFFFEPSLVTGKPSTLSFSSGFLRKGFSAAFLFFLSSSFVRVLQVAI